MFKLYTLLSERKHKFGFTLIELLVTISIMLVLLGGAIAGFIQFSDRQRAEAYAREVHQLYRIAQSKAAAREVPAGYLNGTNASCNNAAEATRLRGYEVRRDGATFSVRAVCGPSNVAGLARSTPNVRTVTSANAAVANTSPVSVIFFTIPDPGETNLTDEATVRIDSAGRRFVFTISPAGAVSTIARTTP